MNSSEIIFQCVGTMSVAVMLCVCDNCKNSVRQPSGCARFVRARSGDGGRVLVASLGYYVADIFGHVKTLSADVTAHTNRIGIAVGTREYILYIFVCNNEKIRANTNRTNAMRQSVDRDTAKREINWQNESRKKNNLRITFIDSSLIFPSFFPCLLSLSTRTVCGAPMDMLFGFESEFQWM